jgi:Zn finger protein HypA/HybF involved in hydrogenase expression
MHEYAIVDGIVTGLLRRLDEEGNPPVATVRFRRGSAFDEPSLMQAFEMLSAGTSLEGASLDIETVNLDFECRCGHKQVITSDDLEGHMFICPGCGFVREVEESHDLELIGVHLAEPAPASGA